MKRTVSILLLVIFLFNVGGYYIVFWGLRQHANQEIAKKLDANLYAGYQTFELKIPVTLPYPLQQQNFERVNGKFEYNGDYYQLVKQKLENDTLYIVCIKNQSEKKLEKTMTEYAKLANDLPATSKKAINFLGKLLKDFQTTATDNIIHLEGWSAKLSLTFHSFETSPYISSIPSPPPKV